MNTVMPTGQLRPSTGRIESIDLLRGVVMIIMALDHVRDYFHADAFLYNPVNLQQTSVALFATRWITHFCAPVFVFLAGTSAFLVGTRKGKAELSAFLLKRGLWLVLLEFTVLNFAWFFNIHFSFLALTVIWGLAMGMIALAAAVHLPFKVILGVGLLLVAGHNLTDGFHIAGDSSTARIWSLLHEPSTFQLFGATIYVGYPMLPWIGIMMLGYCFGKLYVPAVDPAWRKQRLLVIGIVSIIAFIGVRAANTFYGDPFLWETQRNGLYTFLSFMNVTKYPPSILYILITLGPAMIFLAFSERLKEGIWQKIIALGRVPMFYYIVHIYVIHIIALIAAVATGFDLSDMVFNTWITDSPNLKGYGFSLGVVYGIWIVLVLALFPVCLWYDSYKRKHRDQWWLSYL